MYRLAPTEHENKSSQKQVAKRLLLLEILGKPCIVELANKVRKLFLSSPLFDVLSCEVFSRNAALILISK
jgi:hypothetical protein